MFRRVFLVALLMLTACASGDAGGGEQSGRLVVTRAAPGRRTLLDMPAVARFCERDSTLSIVAVGEDWTGAVALRSAWPLAGETRFSVASPLGAAGSAAVAARPLRDTTQPALIGTSGTITVTPGALLAGHIEAMLPGDSGTTIALGGRFEDLAVRTGACP